MKPSPCTVKNLLAVLDDIAAFDHAETWDNVGLMVGDPGRIVSGILVALDPTEDILKEALDNTINAVVTHHPLIFHPLKSIRTDKPSGRILAKALSADLSVVGWHRDCSNQAIQSRTS